MRPMSRVIALIATVASAPLVAFAFWAAIYIAYSLLTQTWYRDTFGLYGLKLLVLYCLYALGVCAAAALALGFRWTLPGRRGLSLRVAVVGGLLAAVLLELMFWSDIGDHMLHGAVFLPFFGWALFAYSQRHAA